MPQALRPGSVPLLGASRQQYEKEAASYPGEHHLRRRGRGTGARHGAEEWLDRIRS